MIVIADTGPVNYLILIGEIEILPALFQRVLGSFCGMRGTQKAARSGRGADMDCPTWIANHQSGWRFAGRADRPARIWLTSMPANVTPFCWRRNWEPIKAGWLAAHHAGGWV